MLGLLPTLLGGLTLMEDPPALSSSPASQGGLSFLRLRGLEEELVVRLGDKGVL